MTTEKNILVVSYYWPPAGGPGVQRWLKFTKYLPEFGWNPIVYIPENPSYPIIDNSLVNDIPKHVTVLKNTIWEPYRWAEFFSSKNKKFKGGQFETQGKKNWKSALSVWVRGNLFIPDARKFWVNPSAKFLEKYIKEHSIDTLVTTGPPHSMHLIGIKLKKKLPNICWVADFRDPWTEISYYKHLNLTKWADAKHRKMEEKVFRTADITLATSPTDAQNFKNKGANAHCITNGFDTEENKKPKEKKQYFTISYVGVLEQLRNPSVFWKAIGELCSENYNFRKYTKLQLVGRIDNNIIEEINENIPKENINILGYMPHEKSYEIMLLADILLITNFPKQESAGIIPGKLYEYLSTGNTIVSIGPKQADVDKILIKTNAGKHFTYHDKNEIKKYILEKFNNHQQKNTPEKELSPEIMAFSRKKLTQQLTTLLNEYFASRQLR